MTNMKLEALKEKPNVSASEGVLHSSVYMIRRDDALKFKVSQSGGRRTTGTHRETPLLFK